MLLCLGWYYWRRGWDSFSPAQAKKQSTGLFFFAPCSSLLLRSRPVSLSFTALIFHPPDALDSASSPTRIVCFKIFLRFTRYEQRDTNFWRTQLQPIRTTAEIIAHIKILLVHQPYLYQKLSKKATQLRLLGMTYEQIAESLHINRKTAIKACEYQGRWANVLAIKHLQVNSSKGEICLGPSSYLTRNWQSHSSWQWYENLDPKITDMQNKAKKQLWVNI